MKLLLKSMNIGEHVICLDTLVLGYKVNDTDYYSLNYLLSVMYYSIFKAYCISKNKEKNVDIYVIFRNELTKILEIDEHLQLQTSHFIKRAFQFIDKL